MDSDEIELPPMTLEIRGRTTGNASDLTHSVGAYPGYAVIRIDDRLNPPAWVEVTLTTEQLADLAQAASLMAMQRDWDGGGSRN
jgi:hypothetical protein